MNTTHTRLTAAVGAVLATMAAPALLILGAATAQATPDISARGPAGTIADLPTPRTCGGCDGFNPKPDKPDYPDLHPPLTRDPGNTTGISVNWDAP